MKSQKNLILMVVAVGCGLVAAFLTTQMSAKSAPVVETAEVLVASKDLPVGTYLGKDEMPKAVKRKRIPKDAVPQVLVLNEDELLDKRLTRAVRADETFNPGDLAKGGIVTLPPGMDMISFSVSIDQAVAGFVGPGCYVDVLATAKAGNRHTAFPLLVNMLVMAVDTNTQYPDNKVAFTNVGNVSMAVDRKQALLIKLAQSRGCGLSLVLRNPDKHPRKDDEKWTVDDVLRMLEDGIAGGNTGSDGKSGSGSSVETVALPVARENIPAGTKITPELIDQKFQQVEYPAPGPENAVKDMKSWLGKTVVERLVANQFVPKDALGEEGPRPETKPARPAGPPAKTHDVVMQNGSGTRMFRYQEVKPGEWKLLGEVVAGAVIPADGSKEAPAEPDVKPEGQDKPAPKGAI